MGPFLDGDSQVSGKSVDDDVRSSLRRGHVRIFPSLSFSPPFHPSPFAFPFSVRTVTSRLDLNYLVSLPLFRSMHPLALTPSPWL
ncbi:hypothetical protein RU639_009103 [Aspergillus parasiticus]